MRLLASFAAALGGLLFEVCIPQSCLTVWHVTLTIVAPQNRTNATDLTVYTSGIGSVPSAFIRLPALIRSDIAGLG